ncbi:ninja-family protein AFP3 [Cocos nucifera]|uniref:Ninja-family protein n=1 Tax=Cocos nucifera TaxID=13894 RepID=A0A8K0I7U6_COCNU|nr:ninja-family protein AFP3 [Cocos nucifera]
MEKETSSRNESYSRDFLKRFAGNSFAYKHPEATGGDSDEIELSLGLSLGGCFGADPKGKKLFRSSSIASFSSLPTEPEFPVATVLSRTSSLPTETEEERRKRKELQSLKRLEAKRKRSEKRNSLKRWTRVDEDGEGGQSSTAPPAPMAGTFEVGLNGSHGLPGGGQFGGVVNMAAPPGMPGWAASSGQLASWPMSQGSIGSQGSSSSCISEHESRPKQGFDESGFGCTEVRGTSTFQSLPEHAVHQMAANAPTSIIGGGEEDPAKKNAGRGDGIKEMERNMIEEMPCVSTKGDGPNGRRIEGFLYKYRKGEEDELIKDMYMNSVLGFVTIFILSVVSPSQKPKQPLQTFRPLNIAHHGSNGKIP